MFLFLFGNMILVELCPDFLLKQEIFLFGDKLSPVFQHGFLRSAENVYLHNLLVLFGKILFHKILYSYYLTLLFYINLPIMIKYYLDGSIAILEDILFDFSI